MSETDPGSRCRHGSVHSSGHHVPSHALKCMTHIAGRLLICAVTILSVPVYAQAPANAPASTPSNAATGPPAADSTAPPAVPSPPSTNDNSGQDKPAPAGQPAAQATA